MRKITTNSILSLFVCFCLFYASCNVAILVNAEEKTNEIKYKIVDTGQDKCFGNSGEIKAPKSGESFYGQDAQHKGNQPSYKDNGDGTISDLVTGLIWVKARGEKVTWDKAIADAKKCKVGGYSDWRAPSIKELYSLINFNGYQRRTASDSKPYIDTKYFDFKYGGDGTSPGNRMIDCQDWSSTEYVSTTMDGNPTVFGVNFADGRIKGYPKTMRMREGTKTNTLYVRYVRGNPDYGKNIFIDNGNKTISDKATNLMWSKEDSQTGMNWKDALAWVQKKNSEKYLGYSDWRLPNAKELHSIVHYKRSPDTTKSPALDPIFSCTKIKNEGGKEDYPFFWTGTTHIENLYGVYIAFGRALGFNQMPPESGNYKLQDVHGAGAQRSDPKDGKASDYPKGKGPQGDVIRILNYVRLVREISK